MHITYFIISGIVFLFFSIVWNTSSFVNVLVKTLMIVMAFMAGLLIIFQYLPAELILSNGAKVY